jgi:hypothetical protein
MNGGLDLNKNFSLQILKLVSPLDGKMVSQEPKVTFIVA